MTRVFHPDSCVNAFGNDTQCDSWARDGECDLDNADWMERYCARACAICKEEDEPEGKTIREMIFCKP